ncbi:hypothetical protein [Paraliomyxa miuraensis]|uniref:hypothetical protein n=1 Tax=Paraliomyxa miuraensis TaxID=376150 RepID=UPI00225008A3|nr:hypothetical protein [Paraliomyxa miuraensis]MCX4243817.1 hypothetical protein [Paraliomyxa miuraensis]
MIVCRPRPSWGPITALALGVGLGLASGCEPPRAGSPSRVPGDGLGMVLNVPYPMVDAERIEGAGRAVLASAGLVFISLGPDDREHALPEPIAPPSAESSTLDGPMLVAHHVEPQGAAIETWRALRRQAFGRVEPERGRVVPVAAAEVEALGLRPPAETVWLVGPKGSCRATVGEPLVGAYQGALDTMMVGYRLDGCSGRAWAQIGIVADAIPVDFRWVPARLEVDVVLPHDRAREWDDPLAELIEPPAWPHQGTPAFDSIRVREIPGVSPRVLQLQHALLGELPDDGDPLGWCDVEVSWVHTDGWTHDRWLDSVPFPPDAVEPFLLGAFVNGTQVDALIYDDRLDGLVVVPPGPLEDMDDPQAWRREFVPTGRYDEATLTAWGAQPVRGPLPVGPTCPVEASPSEE